MHEFTGFERSVRSAEDLGEVVRARRREHRLTQGDVALLVGSHRNQIRSIERGEATERLTLLLRVVNELGLDLVIRPRDAGRGLGQR